MDMKLLKHSVDSDHGVQPNLWKEMLT